MRNRRVIEKNGTVTDQSTWQEDDLPLEIQEQLEHLQDGYQKFVETIQNLPDIEVTISIEASVKESKLSSCQEEDKQEDENAQELRRLYDKLDNLKTTLSRESF